MAPPPPRQFIEAALKCTGSFELSYTDPDQKWHIRRDLLSLLQDFPSFTASMDTFIHNDGTTVNLLNAGGTLSISSSTPHVPLTIWLHENYPYAAPIVFVDTSNPVSPIHRDHPFVDPSSGLTTSPYIRTWEYPRCNLKDLVGNLVNLFSRDHPLASCPSPPPGNPSLFAHHPSLASKTEALDRLAGILHYDMMALKSETDDEIEDLLALQQEMAQRVEAVTSIIEDLELEKWSLRDRVTCLAEEADVLINWLKVHDSKRVSVYDGEGRIDDVFDGVDEESRLRLRCLATDKAIEDTIYALEQAAVEGSVKVDEYIRQVRMLAREQFPYRAMVLRLDSHSRQNFSTHKLSN